jgi:hypothetical protein
MGCVSSGEKKPKTVHKNTMRIILLGIGGSGKSTFSKHMQIIHQGGIDVETAKTYRGILLTNILLGLKAIGAQKQDLDNTENYKKSRWISTFDENSPWDDELIERIRSLWDDEGIHETWHEIKDNTLIQLEYLMNNFERYIDPNFIPNDDDILRARQRTTGGDVYTFEEEKTIWELTDVGGQYSERTKWASYFTEKIPHAIIFFLAIDEYNIPNTELKTDQYHTKFELSLSVFREMLCSPGPVIEQKICRIVFLNKADVFEEKLKDDRKWNEFKEALEYNGDRDKTSCTNFIERKLRDINEASLGKKNDDIGELKIHVTNALDRELMQNIAKDIKSSILEFTMKKIGW